MSENLTAAKLATVESAERSEKSVRESKEYSKQKQNPNEKSTEDICKKTAEKVTETCETLKMATSDNSKNPEATKISTSTEPKTCKATGICQMPKTISQVYTFTEPKTVEECQTAKTASETSMSVQSETPEISKVPPEAYQLSTAMSQISISDKSEKRKILEAYQIPETTSKISTSDEEEEELEEISKTSTSEEPKAKIPKHLEAIFPSDISLLSPFIYPDIAVLRARNEKEKAKLKKEESKLSATEQIFLQEVTSPDITAKVSLLPVVDKAKKLAEEEAQRNLWLPILSIPDEKMPPLILAINYVMPSLPLQFLEMFGEMIEVITNRSVILAHGCRENQRIHTSVIDIAILPPWEYWADGKLLPVTFVFDHHLNKDKMPGLYTDVIIADDIVPFVKSIVDLRGYTCALPVQRSEYTPSGLFFEHLQSKGENSILFGNILDAWSGLQALKMVANKQVKVAVVESPVRECYKYKLPGAESLHVLASMGPLPPYRIMIRESLEEQIGQNITTRLLAINKYKDYVEKLSSFGIIGFANNSTAYYNTHRKKVLDAFIPYY